MQPGVELFGQEAVLVQVLLSHKIAVTMSTLAHDVHAMLRHSWALGVRLETRAPGQFNKSQDPPAAVPELAANRWPVQLLNPCSSLINPHLEDILGMTQSLLCLSATTLVMTDRSIHRWRGHSFQCSVDRPGSEPVAPRAEIQPVGGAESQHERVRSRVCRVASRGDSNATEASQGPLTLRLEWA